MKKSTEETRKFINKKKMYISEKVIKRINENRRFRDKMMNESLLREYSHLIEGIDIDDENQTVSFNSSHENNVDTSILINPTYTNINGVDVISIFKRKRAEKSNLDGNPLIYALKNIKGWKFKNPESDIINLLKQFIRITEKIEPKYDTIITIPSNNQLNEKFLHRLDKIIKTDHQIENYFSKMSTDEVYEDFIDRKQIRKDYSDKYDDIMFKLTKFFRTMEKNNDGYFSYKYIKDLKLRKYITKTMYSDDDEAIEYVRYINNKNILVLDDTIGSGATISEACKSIIETFTPKSITVITLFSKL